MPPPHPCALANSPQLKAHEHSRNLSPLCHHRHSTTKTAFPDPRVTEPLTPYRPNAMRNRLPTHFKGEAKPCRRFCQPRNLTSAEFTDAMKGSTKAGFLRFRTTNQNYYAYDTRCMEVGATNQGIVSEKSKIIHAKQED